MTTTTSFSGKYFIKKKNQQNIPDFILLRTVTRIIQPYTVQDILRPCLGQTFIELDTLFRKARTSSILYSIICCSPLPSAPNICKFLNCPLKPGGGTPIQKGQGCSSEILQRTSMRYQYPSLWTWLKCTNSKSKIIKGSRFRPFEA